MELDFLLMFTLGLASSLHCAQMCGPIVLSYSVALGNSNPRMLPLWANHLAYNAGRLLTYSALGAAAGLVGSSVEWMGKMAGFSRVLMLSAGGLMIVVGLVMFGMLPGSKLLASRSVQFTSRFVRPFSRFMGSPGSANRFVLGLGMGLIPCGMVYAALIKATATGSMAQGAGSMLAFGLGTAGSLLAVGMFSSAIRSRVLRWNAQLAAASVTLTGLLLVWRGARAAAWMAGAHALHVHH